MESSSINLGPLRNEFSPRTPEAFLNRYEEGGKMIHNLKSFGFALAAVFAMSGLTASAASAGTEEFHTTAEPAIWRADQEVAAPVEFTVAGQAIKCKTTSFKTTTAKKTVASLNFTPTLKECSYGSRNTVIATNGCTYKFTGATTVNKHGPIDIECPTGKQIEITIEELLPTCKIYIGSQNSSDGINYTNEATDITGKMTATLKFAKVEGAGLKCEEINNAGQGKYTGGLTIRAFNDLESEEEGEQLSAEYL
jgi:hypothetical protein